VTTPSDLPPEEEVERESPVPPVLSEPDVAPVAVTSPTAEAVIWPIRVASEWAARLLVIAAAGYILLRLLDKVSLVAFSFALAVFFASVLHPVETRLRTLLGGRKSLSSAIVLLGGIVVFGLVGWFVVAQITDHASTLSDQVTRVINNIKSWLHTGPFQVDETQLNNWSSDLTKTLKSHESDLVSGALTTAQVAAEFLGGLLLSILSTFFLLRDGDVIWRWALRLVPRAARVRVDYAGERAWHTLAGYVRGQVTIAFIHAVTITIVLLILRVPLAAALGVVIFLGSFIPILGLTIAGTICVAVTLLEHGLTAAVVIAVVIILLVQAEGNLLQPLIMSRAVHIHPLAVAIAVSAGTTLYGIVGALISVPIVAFTNSFVHGLRDENDSPGRDGVSPPKTQAQSQVDEPRIPKSARTVRLPLKFGRR
jgi:predicted PurR-regulated permease PerM